MKIYIAGALFSIAEKNFNIQLRDSLLELDNRYTIFLPQEYANHITGQEDFEKKVFDSCIEGILHSDCIIAILEGPDADSGTCIELGFAYAHKKEIIGVRTDFRSSEFEGLNIMVRKVLTHYLYVPYQNNSVKEIAGAIHSLLIGSKEINQ